jgi:hypothetical protein
MKKILLVIAFYSLATTLLAQSPRLQLIEEFTSEDDPQAALLDPAFNLFLAQHNNSVIPLKYEGPDPNFGGFIAYTTSSIVNARENYYFNIPSTPMGGYGLQDGKAFRDTSLSNKGALHWLTADSIASRSNVVSPFSLQIKHWFSPLFDSIIVQTIITATLPYTAHNSALGNLRYRLALVEAAIHVKNPTGSNGQKDYYNTMRDMLPNAAGKIISNSWQVGQADTMRYAIALNKYPLKYLYNYSQIAFVGFLQDDGYTSGVDTANVLQAAYSPAIALPSFINDAGITNITLQQPNHCADSLAPQFVLTNYGPVTVTSAYISYQLNQGISWGQRWVGSLAAFASDTISFNAIAVAPGTINLVGQLDSINGHKIGNSITTWASKYD